MRYDVNNGITLCIDCHDSSKDGSFHNLYGTHNNTIEQLREYILNKSGIDIYQTHKEILNLSNKKLITESVQCASTLSEENFNKEGDQHGKT